MWNENVMPWNGCHTLDWVHIFSCMKKIAAIKKSYATFRGICSWSMAWKCFSMLCMDIPSHFHVMTLYDMTIHAIKFSCPEAGPWWCTHGHEGLYLKVILNGFVMKMWWLENPRHTMSEAFLVSSYIMRLPNYAKLCNAWPFLYWPLLFQWSAALKVCRRWWNCQVMS